MSIRRIVYHIRWWNRVVSKRMLLGGILCVFVFPPIAGGITSAFSNSTAIEVLIILLVVGIGIVMCISAFYRESWYCSDCGQYIGRGIEILPVGKCKCGSNVVTTIRPHSRDRYLYTQRRR